MPRNHADAQPARVLTDEEWADLKAEVDREKRVSVEALCRARGVSRQRFYRKFPVGKKPPAGDAR